MKKILFLVLIFYPIALFSQPASGDGTSGNPYSGIITTPWTLTGNQFCGDLIVSSGTFTINAGATLQFGSVNSLTISGTGVLSANGINSSSYITFTASGSSWGHIYFDNATAIDNSIVNYCIIENGDARNLSPAFGGGIHANTSKLVISNSLIQNNKAVWGGGILVNQSMNPSISRCQFYNNESNEGGGGLYLWNYATSTIDNCLFESNKCVATSAEIYSGGGLSAQSQCSVNILNCTFVNNTSTTTLGQNLLLYESSNSSVINSIFWGSSNAPYLSGTNTINYSAFQNNSIPGTNNINLNSSNSDINGPNFVDPSTRNWAITFVSPCRDAGTSIGTPVTDIIGTPRFGPTDIGAYENQYSRWTGSTSSDWGTASNWFLNMLPSSSSNVVIPHGIFDPIISADETVVNLVTEVGGILNVTADQLLTATILTNAGTFTFQPNAKGTITTIINNGILNLQADATSMSSLIVNNTGVTANIDLYLTGGGGPNYNWHYISSPIPYLNVSTFAPSFTYNVAAWNDDLVTGTLVSGWVAYDGYVYVTKTMGGPTFDNLARVIGIGYDYYAVADQKYTLTGQIKTSDVPVSLSYAVADALHGFNLLGNPFSSGLNWDDIANSVTFPTNTSKTIYFTRDNAQCSYVSGVGVPGDVTGIIPPEQGFFVKTNSLGNSITLPAAARSQGTIHGRYKGTSVIPLVRLALAEGTISDETVVRFDPLAKTGLDYDFDALKMFVSTTSTQIYSALGGTDYSINGQPFPDTLIAIPVVVNLTIDGNHNITVPQLQGLDNYDVTLTDKTTGFTADLKTTPTLSFSASAGTIADRFTLKISKIVTGIENPVVSKNIFNIYPANSMINIQTLSDVWEGKIGSVKVMDLTGKTVGDLNNAEFSKNSLVQVAAPGKGMYMVEIRSGIMRYVGKIMIR